MKLIFHGSEANIKVAVDKANAILNNPAFWDEVEKLPQFDNTALTPFEIAKVLQEANQEIMIVTYWRWNPLRPRTCVNATTVSATKIKINTRCFSHDLKTAVNTLVHEATHAGDFLNGQWDFTHVDNGNDGEEDNTAPWAIGALAEKFV